MTFIHFFKFLTYSAKTKIYKILIYIRHSTKKVDLLNNYYETHLRIRRCSFTKKSKNRKGAAD